MVHAEQWYFSTEKIIFIKTSFKNLLSEDNFEYCTTVDDEDGECVALSRCPELSMTMKKMNPRMAQRMLQRSKRACDNYDMDNDPEVIGKKRNSFDFLFHLKMHSFRFVVKIPWSFRPPQNLQQLRIGLVLTFVMVPTNVKALAWN